MYWVMYTPRGNVCLVDQNGFLATKDSLKSIIDGLGTTQEYYETLTDNDIEEINLKHFDYMNSEFFGYNQRFYEQMRKDREGLDSQEKRNRGKFGSSGWVYVIKVNDENGIYRNCCKIGKTRKEEPSERIVEYSPKLPFETELVKKIYCSDAHNFEKKLHEHFANRKIRGEWFDLSDDDINSIEVLAVIFEKDKPK